VTTPSPCPFCAPWLPNTARWHSSISMPMQM
jgi:hypothetical protein